MRKVIYDNDSISIDSGFFLGRGVFETILVKETPIFLEEHIKRINKSIIELDLGGLIVIEDVINFINQHNIKNKALKITVTEKNLIYSIREIKYKDNDYQQGFKVGISKVLRNSTSRIVGFKTLNYLENIIEYELCQRNGFKESIFFNEQGNLCEGCTSNIFIIKDKIIYTPSIKCGLLPGIVRQWVINNFDVVEKKITKEELLNSDEVFLTNSLVGVIKVSNIENKLFNSEIIEKIKEQYDKGINGGEKHE
ncbi:aminotransferase class IV [Clostridium sp.]|uniref:aminotransferase class IV n=1 Tax=Clostridium sp. TaxID=1506 RepID=UPI00263A13D8|nr:aminotransferase class IV [Clostridium sp.]